MIARIHNAAVRGSLTAPPSKSHTIRALLIAALAEGESVIENYLDSDDAHSCMNAVRLMGAGIEVVDAGGIQEIRVRGIGGREGSFQSPDDVVDVGNSGTTLFLSAGVAALSSAYTVFTGDEQIRRRSAQNLLDALQGLGAEAVSTRNNGCAPLIIRGPMTGGRIELSCPVSQYISGLMLACPLMPRNTVADIRITLLNERPYAEMTERWLRERGIEFENQGWERIRIPGGQRYPAFRCSVPGDFSGATFFACAAALSGGRLVLRGLDIGDSQGDKAVFSILGEMGCVVEYEAGTGRGSGEICIAAPEDWLRGGTFDLNTIPDTLPALAVTAAFARGETRLLNVPQARLKETDRISCMAGELGKMGVETRELPDGLVIWPGRMADQAPPSPRGAELDGHGDHRIAMACAIAGLASQDPVTVLGAEAVSVTFPQFFDLLDSCTRSAGTAEGAGGKSGVELFNEQQT